MKSSDKEPLFCDNHLLVVDKPANLPTQPRPTGGASLETEAKEWVKRKFHKKGNVFLTPVHRLDMPVSGLVLFARTSKALSRLQEQMREKQFEKTYIARVEGLLKKKEGKLRHFLSHGSHRAHVVSKEVGKEALLSYCVFKEDAGASWVKVELQTGRYHQIRAQFAQVGHPICGDRKYGAKGAAQLEGIDLHHGKLSFFHPISKERLTLKTPFFVEFFLSIS